MSDSKILRSDDREELEESVNDYLSEGWIPSGTLTYLETENADGEIISRAYIQTMVRSW